MTDVLFLAELGKVDRPFSKRVPKLVDGCLIASGLKAVDRYAISTRNLEWTSGVGQVCASYVTLLGMLRFALIRTVTGGPCLAMSMQG